MEHDTLEPLAVTITHAAQLLSLGRSSLYPYVKAGFIKTIRTGHDQRVQMEEVKRIAREGLPPLPKKQAA
jgi:excisionase family DNA binding protein